MANLTNFARTKKVWKTFYRCECPEAPEDGDLTDILRWYENHYMTCRPKDIVDVPLPEYEGV